MSAAERNADFWLRFAHQVLGLQHLHLGYWSEGDALTYDNCIAAQERYTQFLIARIPDAVRSVLDVGAGLGTTSARLGAAGYTVEALSPDAYQREVFATSAPGVPFHACRFQDLAPLDRFDLILMSESSQYIGLDDLFAGCTAQLAATGPGYVLVADWFVRDGETYYGGAHGETEFFATAAKKGYRVVDRQDITDRTVPTLAYLSAVYGNHVVPAYRLGKEMLARHLPRLFGLAQRVARKRIQRLDDRVLRESLDRFDPDGFARRVRYQVVLLQREGDA